MDANAGGGGKFAIITHRYGTPGKMFREKTFEISQNIAMENEISFGFQIDN